MQLVRTKQGGAVRRVIKAPSEVAEQAQQGKALILVEHDFDERYVPQGYTKLNIHSPEGNLVALVPGKAFFYLNSNNLGNGGIEEGLEALADLYKELEEASDGFSEGRGLTSGGVDLALTVRRNYSTLLANSLVQGKGVGAGKGKGNDELSVGFDPAEIDRLCLEDEYVDSRMRAIAAIAKGVPLEDIKERAVKDALGFQGVQSLVEHFDERGQLFRKVTQMRYIPHGDPHTKEMRCLGDSHYFLKDEFKEGRDGWDYDLRTMTRTRTEIPASQLKQLEQLEAEIAAHQKEKGVELTTHDANRTRVAINIKYGAGLVVQPEGKKNE
jgi:hypothetical protein